MAKYNKEFKLEVVNYYKENGKAETCRKYDISSHTVYTGYNIFKEFGVNGLERKQFKNYTLKEKLEIIKYYRKNGQKETRLTFGVTNSLVRGWERKLIEEGEDGLANDKRGRSSKSKVKNNVNQNEDLLAEVQRLRMENAYLKKLDALVQKRVEKQRKKK